MRVSKKHQPISIPELNNIENSAQELARTISSMLNWTSEEVDKATKHEMELLYKYPALIQSLLPCIIKSNNMAIILDKIGKIPPKHVVACLTSYPEIDNIEVAKTILKASIDTKPSPFSSGERNNSWRSLLCKKIKGATLSEACRGMSKGENYFDLIANIYFHLARGGRMAAQGFKEQVLEKHRLFQAHNESSKSCNIHAGTHDYELPDLDLYLDQIVQCGIITITDVMLETCIIPDEFEVALIYDKELSQQQFIAMLHSYYKALMSKTVESQHGTVMTKSIKVYTSDGIFTVDLNNIGETYRKIHNNIIDDTQSSLLA